MSLLSTHKSVSARRFAYHFTRRVAGKCICRSCLHIRRYNTTTSRQRAHIRSHAMACAIFAAGALVLASTDRPEGGEHPHGELQLSTTATTTPLHPTPPHSTPLRSTPPPTQRNATAGPPSQLRSIRQTVLSTCTPPSTPRDTHVSVFVRCGVVRCVALMIALEVTRILYQRKCQLVEEVAGGGRPHAEVANALTGARNGRPPDLQHQLQLRQHRGGHLAAQLRTAIHQPGQHLAQVSLRTSRHFSTHSNTLVECFRA